MRISLCVRPIAVAAIAGLCAVGVLGQGFPTKPVNLFVGYGAGGPTDVVARIFADRLSKRFQQPFVVVNVPGANGELAMRQLLDKPAEGYSLMWAASSQLIHGPAIQKAPRIDAAVRAGLLLKSYRFDTRQLCWPSSLAAVAA